MEDVESKTDVNQKEIMRIMSRHGSAMNEMNYMEETVGVLVYG
jgi:hypothetical protein